MATVPSTSINNNNNKKKTETQSSSLSTPKERSPTKSHHFNKTNIVYLGIGSYIAIRTIVAIFHRSRRNLLRSLLADITSALDDLKVTYWLDFGSLLGIHRDGDLIIHDNDIDFAILDPDWVQLLPRLQQRLPQYSVKIVTPNESPESSWIRVYTALGMADLFGAYTNKNESNNNLDNSVVYVDCGHGDTMAIDKNLVLPPSRKFWRDIDLSVPYDIEGTLERRYGEDWAIPKYMDKGADTIESSKPYARLFKVLAKIGIKI